MPIHAAWADDQRTILRYDFEQDWDWADLYQLRADLEPLLERVEHSIDILFHMPERSVLPPNFVTNLKGLLLRKHRKVGRIVIVTENRVVHKMLQVFRQYTGGDEVLLAVQTFDEAYARLRGPQPGASV